MAAGRAKLLSYAVNAAAKREAGRHGDDDAPFVSADGYALEAPTAAVIVLRDGVLITTPPGVTGILDLITVRQLFAKRPPRASRPATNSFRPMTCSSPTASGWRPRSVAWPL